MIKLMVFGELSDVPSHTPSLLIVPSCLRHLCPGVYFVVCMALLVISLTETVLIVRLVHKQDLQTPVPDWVKYVVLERAPVLFCIRRKHRLCSRLSSQGSDLDHYKDSSYGTSKDSKYLDLVAFKCSRLGELVHLGSWLDEFKCWL